MLEEYKGRIDKVMDYISFHLNKDISLKRLAGKAHFSLSCFQSVFQIVTGEAVKQLIRRIRLENATNKLKNNPKLNIIKMVYDLGFSSSACFVREFRKKFGISATAYRYYELSKKA